jgi:hypothetical protein
MNVAKAPGVDELGRQPFPVDLVRRERSQDGERGEGGAQQGRESDIAGHG